MQEAYVPRQIIMNQSTTYLSNSVLFSNYDTSKLHFKIKKDIFKNLITKTSQNQLKVSNTSFIFREKIKFSKIAFYEMNIIQTFGENSIYIIYENKIRTYLIKFSKIHRYQAKNFLIFLA